jgi:hypothetical protein
MLTIRREQMRILAAPSFERFVRRGLTLVETHFGDQFASLGEAAVRDAVLYAVERAERHGLTTDQDVLSYLTLMFVFGRDFDRDPRLAWASEALQAPGRSAAFRMSRLQSLALSHQHAGCGYRAAGQASHG